MKTGIELIAEEQQRKKEIYGYDVSDHDLKEFYEKGQCREAAIQYLGGEAVDTWPSDWAHEYKPGDNPIRDLQKAGAFIADEIDRLNQTITAS